MVSDYINKIPLYEEIYRRLRDEIGRGVLKAGDKLLSKRLMAQELGVSVNTVTSAYEQLVDEGFVTASPRRGFFVSPMDTLRHIEIEKSAEEAAKAAEKPPLDFSVNDIAASHFPIKDWKKAVGKCFAAGEESITRGTPAKGNMDLRRAIAAYLHQFRGFYCSPRQVVIGAGSDNLLQILSYIMDSSASIGMENPVYHKAYNFFRRMGHEVISFPVDGQGMVVPGKGDIGQSGAVYITPSHQFPLGTVMPISRRIKLLNWAASYAGRYIIEDDYDSEFRYRGRPIPSLKSLDKTDSVVYLGTFSKALSPSFRISYMVLPEELLKSYEGSYGDILSPVSGFEQAALAEFITSGNFVRHLSRMRKLYRSRRDFLIGKLEELFPPGYLSVCGEAAGLYFPVQLANGMSEDDMCESAMEKGARVYPVSPYFVGDVPEEHRSKVLLGYGNLNEEELSFGAELLREAWS